MNAWHKVELFDGQGRCVATLYGDDAVKLKARAARWDVVLNSRLELRYSPPIHYDAA